MTIEPASVLFLPDIDPTCLADLRGSLGAWYNRVQRELPWRRTDDPYAIWVSEVMLQQTRVTTVVPYYHRFMERFPDVAHLADADLQSVYKLWEGLGYYTRARNLHLAARTICARMGGRVPDDARALRTLPGVGAYICAAVLSIAFGQAFAVVDGNVKRVLARLFLLEAPANQAAGHALFQSMADRLLDRSDPGRHNQAMMELGATVCTPRRPQCDQCVLAVDCKAFQGAVTDRYPRRIKRPGLAEHSWVAAVIVKNGRFLLTQRPPKGLLGGLWELPCATLQAGDDPLAVCVPAMRSTTGLQIELQQHVGCVHHAYTHFKLRMEVCVCLWRQGRVRLGGPAAAEWVRPGQTGRYALHAVVHKALTIIRKGVSIGY
jgi:A/G-specific adenine glycosylase